MGSTTIKIQNGVSIFSGMAAVADAVARGKKKYRNDNVVVISRKRNTYLVFKRRNISKT